MTIYESLRLDGHGRRRGAAAMAGFAVAVCAVGIAPAAAVIGRSGSTVPDAIGSPLTRVGLESRAQGDHRSHVRLSLGSPVIDLVQSASVSVSGMTAQQAEVRLLGAIDRSGLAYQWTPYRWRRLRLVHGMWHGVLPAPALHGIYRLQLRLDHGRTRLSSHSWLLRVFPRGSSTRQSFPTPLAAVRSFVAHRPGDEVLVAVRQWPEATFDHRDPRLHRLFVVAYAPRGDSRVSSRLGLFITAVREGYHGRWRVLTATIEPYG